MVRQRRGVMRLMRAMRGLSRGRRSGLSGPAAMIRCATRMSRLRYLQCLGPTAQGRMVRHGELETEQLEDGPDQPFCLTQGQAEHGPQRQGRGDCQGRIRGLSTPDGTRPRFPGRDRFLREPHHQAPASTQAGIHASVRHPVPLVRDVVPAVLIRFEWQTGRPYVVERTCPSATLPQGTPTADPCTKVSRRGCRVIAGPRRLPAGDASPARAVP
jgi:hypothetical protein